MFTDLPAARLAATPSSSSRGSSFSSSASRRDSVGAAAAATAGNPLERNTPGTPVEADAALPGGVGSPATPPLLPPSSAQVTAGEEDAPPPSSHNFTAAAASSISPLTQSARRAVSQWAAATPPLHPSLSPLQPPAEAVGELSLCLFPPAAGGGAQRAETVAGPTVIRPRGRTPVSGFGGTLARSPAARTPRGLPSRQQQQDEEEITQLARSLRSEIVGEPFLLTAAFSPVSRGLGSGSRPSSAISGASTSGGEVGSGDRRRAATATTNPTMSPVVPVLAAPTTPAPATTALLPSGRRASETEKDEAALLPVPCAHDDDAFTNMLTVTASQATPAAAAAAAAPKSGQSRPAVPSREAADSIIDVDGLHSVAELRRRLLTEDFFSSPFRKFRRDGAFPWKLFTSVVLCVQLLLQVTWYQLPLARANESMRRAITEQFMGDDFDSKGHGDVVAAPTAWMEGLYSSVEHYVAVYYNLSNTSSSDMNYYASVLQNSSHSDDGEAWRDEVGCSNTSLWCIREDASAVPRRAGVVTAADVTAAPTPPAPPPPPQPDIPLSAIAPVVMRVRVDAFSRREGTQHVDTIPGALAALRRGSWWDWTSSAGRYLEDGWGGGETRWLTFLVDAAHPLGPFAKYRDAVRRLRKADKQQRRQARAFRKAERKDAKRMARDGDNDTDTITVTNARDDAGLVDTALSVVCSPRVDDLTGRFYRPCASVPPASRPTGAATMNAANGDDNDTASPPPPSRFFPEFSLMDNVRAIHLVVTLRHETGEDGNTLSRGSSTVSAGLDSRGVGAVQEEAAVFQWRVEKVIAVHPGGLVETQLHVQTRIWPKGAAMAQRWRPSHDMAALLGVFALLELVLRVRALWRIMRYQERLRKERLAFHAQQMRQESALHRPGARAAAAVAAPGTQAPVRRTVAAAAAIPYEWGLPGTPAVRYVGGGAAPATFPASGPATTTTYGTMALASAKDTVSGGETLGRQGATPAAATFALPPSFCSVGSPALPTPLPTSPTAGLLARSESSPLLVHDTSLSILAAQHLTAVGGAAGLVGDAEGEACVPPPASAGVVHVQPATTAAATTTWRQRMGRGSWLGRQLRHATATTAAVLPSSDSLAGAAHSAPCAVHSGNGGSRGGKGGLGESAPRRADSAPAAAPPLTPRSGESRTPLLRSPLFGVSPLTRQQTERIVERSYVDLHTMWRHHLQQTMGVGWHWVGIIAAVLTLSYSVLLLLPLLPCVEVAQDGRYDAWTSVLLGTAALTSCVLLLSYLRFFPTLYFPIFASTYVLPKLFLFALCVSPLFFGFAVFFKVAFGPYSKGRFASLGWTSMGLYVMTYGDALLDTIAVISDTPYAITTLFANVMVIAFALLFMTIMLNFAMTITQHEWLRLRRRFGAALSSSNLLFSVRSRAEVKAEAVETVRTNLEVLMFMLAEEEEQLLASRMAQASDASDMGSSRSNSGSPWLLPSLATTAAAKATATAISPPALSTWTGEEGRQKKTASRTMRRGAEKHRLYSREAPPPPQQQQQLGARANSAEDGDEEGESYRREGRTSRGRVTGNSSYDASTATTVPPE